ncbi:unnamed protein product [Heterobilharzia americana]|nr:unnamed protein product [Heterobilharzia americana]
MDMFKGYLKSVVDIVSNLAEPNCGDTTEGSPKNVDKQYCGDEDSQDTWASGIVSETLNQENPGGGYFSWVPNLLTPNNENSVLYYMNSLASMGVNPNDESEQQTPQKTEQLSVITTDISKIQVSDNTDVSEVPEFQVWEQIKQDFSEVVSSVSEPKDVVYRTASSVRDHITAAANTVKNIDPDEFLLPNTEEKVSKQPPGNTDDSDVTALPPELPSLPKIKQDVSQLIDSLRSGLISTGTFFGLISTEEDQSKDNSKHKARLDVLRADPATYELEPPVPPVSSNIHSYYDWRTAYFDEDTCQPMDGIPLADAKNPEYSHLPVEELTQPPHPSPAELLDSYPFMRTYLTQLVHPDGKINEKSISDADFWSRYYYRVWLLDSTEFRRRRLNERVESTNWSMNSNGTSDNLNVTEEDKWPDTLDSDDHTTVENESVISNDKVNTNTVTTTTVDSTGNTSVSGKSSDGECGTGKKACNTGGDKLAIEKKRKKKRGCKKPGSQNNDLAKGFNSNKIVSSDKTEVKDFKMKSATSLPENNSVFTENQIQLIYSLILKK